MARRDIIVIGASAGGIEAVQQVVAGFPVDLRAAVFVTNHLHPRMGSALPKLLTRAGPLSAVDAEDGMAIAMSTIFVAPPDFHLVIQNGFMQLSHGPRENLQRPCINVMFRSAATAYGERVAGVVLTGLLDDGAAGLWEIQRNHGATVVQDPEEAAFRSMPDSAVRGLNVQYIVRLREIAPLLTRLSVNDGKPGPPAQGEPWVEPGGQACPECGGAMTKTRMGGLLEFRCHTGHRLGLKSMITHKSMIVEGALGAALAHSEELVGLLRAAVGNGGSEGTAELNMEMDRRQAEQEVLRGLLENGREAETG